MAVRRIIPYYESPDPEATRAFYTQVIGLEEGSFGGGYIGFGSARPRSSSRRRAWSPSCPTWAWTSVVAPSMRRTRRPCEAGHEVIYGPVDEPWGVRRFFVRDPHGVVLSVLAHE